MKISSELYSILKKDTFLASDMVAASRGVVYEIYNSLDIEFPDYIYVFVSIEDQTTNITLNTYGKFNNPQGRFYIKSFNGESFQSISQRPMVNEGTKEFEVEMDDIFTVFAESYNAARLALISAVNLS